MPCLRKHPSHDMPSALVQSQFHYRPAPGALTYLKNACFRSLRRSACFDPHTWARKCSYRFMSDESGDLCDIGLVHFEGWMSQPVHELTVVGEEDETFCGDIEASDRDYTLFCSDNIQDGGSSAWIFRCSDYSLRLVQRVIPLLYISRDPVPIDPDHVSCSIHALAQPRGLTVHRHSSLRDQLFGRSPGGDPC